MLDDDHCCGIRIKTSFLSAEYQRHITLEKVKSKAGSKDQRKARKLMLLAERNEPKVVADLIRGILIFKEEISIAALEAALIAGEFEKVNEIIPWDSLPDNFEIVEDEMAKSYLAAARQTVPILASPPPSLRLDTQNPNLIRFIDNEVGRLIVDMKDSNIKGVQQAVVQSLDQGLTPKRAAKLITEHIGLTEKQSVQVMNKQLALITEKESLQDRLALLRTADKGNTKAAVRISARLQNLTNERIDKQVAKLADNLQKNRSVTIARTELTRSVNAGQIEVWNAASDDGIVERENVVKKWVTVPDADRSNICRTLDGQTRKIGETFFVVQTGESVQHPPAHPNCRSAVVIEEIEE